MRLATELLLAAMLIVTSLDLLYLYIVGAWYDPIPAIEWAEIIALMLCIAIALTYICWRVANHFVSQQY